MNIKIATLECFHQALPHHLRCPWERCDHSEIVNVDVACSEAFL